MPIMLRDTQRIYAIEKKSAFWKLLLLLTLLLLSACDINKAPEWLVCDGIPMGQNSRVDNATIVGTDEAGYRYYVPLSRFNVCKFIPDDQLHPATRARWELNVEAAQ